VGKGEGDVLFYFSTSEMIFSFIPAFAFKNASPRRTALLAPEGLKRNSFPTPKPLYPCSRTVQKQKRLRALCQTTIWQMNNLRMSTPLFKNPSSQLLLHPLMAESQLTKGNRLTFCSPLHTILPDLRAHIFGLTHRFMIQILLRPYAIALLLAGLFINHPN
jgi:hypothetical protein